jgi:hypothetical protein
MSIPFKPAIPSGGSFEPTMSRDEYQQRMQQATEAAMTELELFLRPETFPAHTTSRAARWRQPCLGLASMAMLVIVASLAGTAPRYQMQVRSECV